MASKWKRQRLVSAGIWAICAAGAIEVGQSQTALALPESESAAEALPQLVVEEEALSAPGQVQPVIAPQAAAPATTTQPAAQLNSAYVLGPGDTIRVEIFNVPEYSGSQQVLADGSVNLTAISPVNVNGLTPQEAEKAIAAPNGRQQR
ncbi:MAG: polysaccharide biosynthesis/export family protein [Cyanobacteria bacterium J06606_4]